MSDKLRNFLIGGGLVLVWGITLGFLDWRASVHAANEVSKFDLGTDAKIVEMDDEIDANTATGSANKERGELTQRQLEQVAAILMRPPDGE